MVKKKVGTMACESCGERVTVRKNELETLSYRCDECDAAPYARLGTGQHQRWTAKIGLEAQPDSTAPGLAAPETAEKPKEANLWGLS